MATTKQLAELFRAVAGHGVPRAVESARRIAVLETKLRVTFAEHREQRSR